MIVDCGIIGRWGIKPPCWLLSQLAKKPPNKRTRHADTQCQSVCQDEKNTLGLGAEQNSPCLFIYLFIYLFIETYLYRLDIISSQAIFHMCPVVILLYENKHSIIYYMLYVGFLTLYWHSKPKGSNCLLQVYCCVKRSVKLSMTHESWLLLRYTYRPVCLLYRLIRCRTKLKGSICL